MGAGSAEGSEAAVGHIGKAVKQSLLEIVSGSLSDQGSLGSLSEPMGFEGKDGAAGLKAIENDSAQYKDLGDLQRAHCHQRPIAYRRICKVLGRTWRQGKQARNDGYQHTGRPTHRSDPLWSEGGWVCGKAEALVDEGRRFDPSLGRRPPRLVQELGEDARPGEKGNIPSEGGNDESCADD